MKKIFLLCFIFAEWFSLNSAYPQNPLMKMWDKGYGGTAFDYFNCIQRTSDNGFIIGGYSESDSSGNKSHATRGGFDYWIVKLDSMGNKQWDKNFGGTNTETFTSLLQTRDGGYLLGGFSFSSIGGDKTQDSVGSYDYWIIKLDVSGNKQWDKTFGGTEVDQLTCLIQSMDGGYLVGGFSYSGSGGDKTEPNWDNTNSYPDYWIVKTDSLGNKQWDKVFGGTIREELYSIVLTLDSGFILAGSSNSGVSGNKTSPSHGNWDYWMLEIDSLGNKIWEKAIGGVDEDQLFSMEKTTDNGFILGGWSFSQIGGDKSQPTQGGIGDIDYWIVKLDSAVNIEWDKDFGGTDWEDYFGNATQTSDGGYLIAGVSFSDSSGNKTQNNLGIKQTWIVKTDPMGNKQWDKTVFSNLGNADGKAIQSADGCYVVGSYCRDSVGGDKTDPSWNNSVDYWIVKFCDSTLATSTTLLEKEQIKISIFPNPTSGQLTIISNHFAIDQIEIYDLLGNKTYSSAANCTSCIVNCEFFPPGIYFVKASSGTRIYSEKFIKIAGL